MTIYSLAQPRNRLRVSDGRRRFDTLTIGLHLVTVTLIAGSSPPRGFCLPAIASVQRYC
jgi:hypothetical protein